MIIDEILKAHGVGVALGDALVTDVLSGKKFSTIMGVGKVGTMPDRSNSWTPAVSVDGSSTVGRIHMKPAIGYYDGGVNAYTLADDADFIAANFLETKNIFGLQGTMPDRNSVYSAATNLAAIAGRLYLRPPAGYFDGVSGNALVYNDDPDFIAANIKNGVNLFGLTGTYMQLAPGNTVAFNGGTLGSTNNAAYEKKGNTTPINFSGTVRVKMTIGNQSGTTSYGRVYLSGVPAGTERSTTSTVGVEFVEDIAVTAGQTIEIWERSNGSVWTLNTPWSVCVASLTSTF